jgi:2',3'-cyclic-nucleotide 2'-phosphodiesterase (5'-nucleotidase family)
LLLVDSGDLHDGTGLTDGFPPGGVNGHEATKFYRQLPYDVMSIGNHELYKYNVAYDMYVFPTSLVPFLVALFRVPVASLSRVPITEN